MKNCLLLLADDKFPKFIDALHRAGYEEAAEELGVKERQLKEIEVRASSGEEPYPEQEAGTSEPPFSTQISAQNAPFPVTSVFHPQAESSSFAACLPFVSSRPPTTPAGGQPTTPYPAIPAQRTFQQHHFDTHHSPFPRVPLVEQSSQQLPPRPTAELLPTSTYQPSQVNTRQHNWSSLLPAAFPADQSPSAHYSARLASLEMLTNTDFLQQSMPSTAHFQSHEEAHQQSTMASSSLPQSGQNFLELNSNQSDAQKQLIQNLEIFYSRRCEAISKHWQKLFLHAKDRPLEQHFIQLELVNERASEDRNKELDDYKFLLTNPNRKPGDRIVIEGDPGTGKSTLLNKIVLDWSNKQPWIRKLFDLVVFMELGPLTETDTFEGSLSKSIPTALAAKLMQIFPSLEDSGRILFVFDAFDEMQGCPAELKPILEGDRFWKGTVLITTRRSHLWKIDPCDTLFRSYGFPDEQVEQLIENDDRIQLLYHQWELVKIPLVYGMYSVVISDPKIMEGISNMELFHVVDMFCKLIFKRHQEMKPFASKNIRKKEQVLGALGAFAFKKYCSSHQTEKVQGFGKALKEADQQRLEEALTVGILWKENYATSNWLFESSDSVNEGTASTPFHMQGFTNTYVFPHQLFLEYFAAYGAIKMWNKINWKDLFLTTESEDSPFLYFCSGLSSSVFSIIVAENSIKKDPKAFGKGEKLDTSLLHFPAFTLQNWIVQPTNLDPNLASQLSQCCCLLGLDVPKDRQALMYHCYFQAILNFIEYHSPSSLPKVLQFAYCYLYDTADQLLEALIKLSASLQFSLSFSHCKIFPSWLTTPTTAEGFSHFSELYLGNSEFQLITTAEWIDFFYLYLRKKPKKLSLAECGLGSDFLRAVGQITITPEMELLELSLQENDFSATEEGVWADFFKRIAELKIQRLNLSSCFIGQNFLDVPKDRQAVMYHCYFLASSTLPENQAPFSFPSVLQFTFSDLGKTADQLFKALIELSASHQSSLSLSHCELSPNRLTTPAAEGCGCGTNSTPAADHTSSSSSSQLQKSFTKKLEDLYRRQRILEGRRLLTCIAQMVITPERQLQELNLEGNNLSTVEKSVWAEFFFKATCRVKSADTESKILRSWS